MPLTPNRIQLTLPGGYSFDIANEPGLTFIVGPNGVGKSYAFKRAAGAHLGKLLYLPPNREVTRASLQHIGREYDSQFSVDWHSQDQLARYWSRAVRQQGLRQLALSLVEQLGLPQRLTAESAMGQIQFHSTDAGQKYSAMLEASGILNLPTLGIAIYDPSHTAIIIDEPENSLHPQAQHVLLQILRDIATRQEKHFILITHSPSMIDLRTAEDLARVIFIRRLDINSPMRVVKQIPQGDAHFYAEILPGLNAYKREAIFADNVIIVEGINDRDFLLTLLETGGYGASFSRTGILPVDGFGDQAKYAAFFKEIGVRPFVISDRDVIYPSSTRRWSPGRQVKGSIEWKGWLSPAAVQAWLSAAPATPNPAIQAFVQLEQLADNIRTKLAQALTEIPQNQASLSTANSLSPVLTELSQIHQGKGKMQTATMELVNAVLSSTDWDTTPLASLLKQIKQLWDQFKQNSNDLDILVLEKGAIEKYYMHDGKGKQDKVEASRAEIQSIIAKYSTNNQGIDIDYSDIISVIKDKKLIARAKQGIPYEAAAAIAGKIQELYFLLFGGGDPKVQLQSIIANMRLEELSPSSTVTDDQTAANPPSIEFDIPLLKGFLSADGRIRLVQGVQPDVFSKLTK